MFQFRQIEGGVNLFECTVLWTLVYVSSGLNTTSSTGGQDKDVSFGLNTTSITAGQDEDVSSGLNTTWNTSGQDEDTSNIEVILPVVFLTVLVFIVLALFVLYKKNIIQSYPCRYVLPSKKGHNDDDFEDLGSSMLNISRDINLRKVNMFEDSFLGIKTRLKRRGVVHSPLFLGNRLHSDPYLASNSTVKNKRVTQDANMQGSAMKGIKSNGPVLQARHADQSIEDSSEAPDGLHVPIYPMKNKSPRGLAVIIGIDKFNNPEYNLEAVALDREMVKATFKAIEFEVAVCKKHNKQEIEQFLLNTSKKNTTDYDCFVCYISSHGIEQHICCKDDDGETSTGLLKIGSVINLFTNDICKTFAGKPKVFFFDICLGENEVKYDSLPKGADKMFENEQERKAAYAHILACYATIPGYVSWADGDGSRFTKALTFAIDKANHKTSMDEIMYAINNIMATTKKKNQQIPSYANELVKKLVFKENLRRTVKRKSLISNLFN